MAGQVLEVLEMRSHQLFRVELGDDGRVEMTTEEPLTRMTAEQAQTLSDYLSRVADEAVEYEWEAPSHEAVAP